jgi:hypothetical protein
MTWAIGPESEGNTHACAHASDGERDQHLPVHTASQRSHLDPPCGNLRTVTVVGLSGYTMTHDSGLAEDATRRAKHPVQYARGAHGHGHAREPQHGPQSPGPC